MKRQFFSLSIISLVTVLLTSSCYKDNERPRSGSSYCGSCYTGQPKNITVTVDRWSDLGYGQLESDLDAAVKKYQPSFLGISKVWLNSIDLTEGVSVPFDGGQLRLSGHNL